MRKIISCLIVFGFTSGCASLYEGSAKRQFSLESKWVRSTQAGEFAAYRRQNRMAPVLFDRLVIQSNAIDGIVAYDQDSGVEVWRLDLEDGVEAGAYLDGDMLYFGSSNGQFYAVNAGSGKVAWTFPVRTETLSVPRVVNGVVYFLSGADIVYALDAKSGKQLWLYNRQSTNSLSIRAGAQPLILGNQVFAGFSDGFLVALRLQDGGLVWEKKISRNERFRDVDSSPVTDGKAIFVASYDGSTYSIDPINGNINWQYDNGSYVPVTFEGENIFLSTSNGHVTCLESATGKEIWKHKVKNGIATQVSLSKGYLAFGESEGALVVLDARSGSYVGRFEPGRGIQGRPVFGPSGQRVYFVSNNANLFTLEFTWKRFADRQIWQ